MFKILKFLSYIVPLVSAIEDARQPNIVFIVADDLGWSDVSFHGSDQIMTPNIDMLAYHGTVLNNYYTDVCGTPSRSALFSGKYPMRMGVQGESIAASEDLGIPEVERLLPTYLRELGYNTYLIGKWNVGKSRPHYLPIHRGFDGFYGFLDGSVDYYTYNLIENWNGSAYYGLNLYHNLEPVEDQFGDITDLFTARAIELIRNHNDTIPFYLHFSHAAPHAGGGMANLQAPVEAITANSHIAHSARRLYAGLVTTLDKSVGKIVATLSERGILQNTIIIIVSDNGAATTGLSQNFGSNYPLRGIKSTPWEGAIRVPALIWHSILPSNIWHGIFHVTDWLPTLIHAAGGKANEAIDGIDHWHALSNGLTSKRKETLLTIDNINGWAAFRDGDLKIIVGNVSPESSLHFGDELTALRTPAPSYETMLLNSDVAKTFNDLFYDLLDVTNITEKRNVLNLTPEYMPDTKDICIPTMAKGCLFNITEDPCETRDLWNISHDIVRFMTLRLRMLWSEMIPRRNRKRDVRANPSNRNYIWSPWLENDQPMEPNNKLPQFPLRLTEDELKFAFDLNVGIFSKKILQLMKRFVFGKYQ